jgi:hypothetical protein
MPTKSESWREAEIAVSNNDMQPKRIANLGVVIVAVHFVVNLVQAAAHMRLHIDMNLWQNVYITLVILLLPLASGPPTPLALSFSAKSV